MAQRTARWRRNRGFGSTLQVRAHYTRPVGGQMRERHRAHANVPDPTCGKCRNALQEAVMHWGVANRRSFPWRARDRTPYELVVAEVLLQQTRAEHVASVFGSVVERCPDWDSLAEIPTPELEDLLRPLGLQNRRAASLVALARVVRIQGLPSSASDLETLPVSGSTLRVRLLSSCSAKQLLRSTRTSQGC